MLFKITSDGRSLCMPCGAEDDGVITDTDELGLLTACDECGEDIG